MRHLANILSIGRIVLLFALFFTFQNPLLFSAVYLTAGLSDILDGYVARKTKTESALGARLDSIADLCLFAVVTVFVIGWMGNKIFVFLPWIIVVAVIRSVNILLAAARYHSFAILHTWGNKLTGLLLFTAPLFILYHQPVLLWVVCAVAMLSAVEETVIHLTSNNLEINRRSFFKS